MHSPQTDPNNNHASFLPASEKLASPFLWKVVPCSPSTCSIQVPQAHSVKNVALHQVNSLIVIVRFTCGHEVMQLNTAANYNSVWKTDHKCMKCSVFLWPAEQTLQSPKSRLPMIMPVLVSWVYILY